MFNEKISSKIVNYCEINKRNEYEAKKELILLRADFIEREIIPAFKELKTLFLEKKRKVITKRITDPIYNEMKKKGYYVYFKKELPYRYEICLTVNNEKEYKYYTQYKFYDIVKNEFEVKKKFLLNNYNDGCYYVVFYNNQLNDIINGNNKIYINSTTFQTRFDEVISDLEKKAKGLRKQYNLIDSMVEDEKNIREQIKEYNNKYGSDIMGLFQKNLILR